MQVSLKQARQLRGLTQIELANQIGVSEPTLVRYEQNPFDMKISTANKIAEVLEFTFDGVAFFVDEESFIEQGEQS